MKTIIRLSNTCGELDRMELHDDDATGTAIAQAVLSLIARAGCVMHAGDTITVEEVD